MWIDVTFTLDDDVTLIPLLKLMRRLADFLGRNLPTGIGLQIYSNDRNFRIKRYIFGWKTICKLLDGQKVKNSNKLSEVEELLREIVILILDKENKKKNLDEIEILLGRK